MGSAEYYAPLARALAPHFRVVRPDLYGRGRSDMPPGTL